MTISLQRCADCGTWQYPRRDVCRSCLSDALAITDHPGTGRLLATSALHRSLDPDLAARLPLRIGTVQLDAGPHLICFVAHGLAPGERVAVETNDAGLWNARALGDRNRK